MDSTFRFAKIKTVISCAVFVFAYANCSFSYTETLGVVFVI